VAIMQERTAALAARFDEAAGEFIAVVEQCTTEGWQAICPDEGWPVGVTAHHVADWWPVMGAFVRAITAGEPLPADLVEGAAGRNDRHAVEARDCTREETLALLRERAAAVSALLRGLEDEQLERTALLWGRDVSALRLIERNLIGHPAAHVDGIRAYGVPAPA
jgi:hypothetical protein